MFDRIISVDWSGGSLEARAVPLGVAVADFDAASNQSRVVDQPHQNHSRWSRQAFRNWITKQLQDKRPALVAMDFGFGLPWGQIKPFSG
jgi:hypothetical protein